MYLPQSCRKNHHFYSLCYYLPSIICDTVTHCIHHEFNHINFHCCYSVVSCAVELLGPKQIQNCNRFIGAENKNIVKCYQNPLLN